MNIQKCKVDKNREWTLATKKTLAAVFGVSALFSLSACDLTSPDSSTSGAPAYIPEGNPAQDNSSSSQSPDGNNSSSSFAIDTLEVTAGEIVPPLESSSSATPSSSSMEYEPPMTAGILPPDHVLPPEPEAGSPFDLEHLSSSSQQRTESSSATSGLSSSFSDVIPPESSSSSDTIVEIAPLAGDPIYIEDPVIDTTRTIVDTIRPVIDTVRVQRKETFDVIRKTDLQALSGCPSNMNDAIKIELVENAHIVPSDELDKENE